MPSITYKRVTLKPNETLYGFQYSQHLRLAHRPRSISEARSGWLRCREPSCADVLVVEKLLGLTSTLMELAETIKVSQVRVQ